MGEFNFYEELGPFAGLSELASQKHISTKSFSAASNVVNRGGSITPRPGFVRARTTPFTSTTSVVSNAGQYVFFDASTSPDRLFYTYGTKTASVKVDGASPADLVNYTPLLTRGIAVDVAGTKVYAVVTNSSLNNSIRTSNLTGGAQATLVTISSSAVGTGARALARNSATGDLFVSLDASKYGTPQSGLCGLAKFNSSGVFQAGSDGALLTAGSPIYGLAVDGTNSLVYYTQGNNIYRQTTSFGTALLCLTAASPMGLHVDLVNNRLWWTESDGSGSRIKYAALTPATGATGVVTTVLSVSSSSSFLGLDVDDTNIIPYYCDTQGSVSTMASTSGVFISGVSMRRGLLGIPNGQFTDDLILLQLLNNNIGGSAFKAYFPARTAPDDFFAMTPGYTAGSGSNPDIFCMISRDANPSSSDPVIPVGNYGRASFAYTGNGFDTHAGGMLVAGSTGGYVFNYRIAEDAANEVQVLTCYGTPTGGTFKLTLSTATANNAYNISAATMQAHLEALAEIGSGNVVCSGGPFPGTPITCTFASTLANRGLPYLYMSTNALTGGEAMQVRTLRTTRGRSHPNGMLWLRPAGLPAPSVPLGAYALEVDGGNLQGVYSYAVSFYSTMLNIESPPSTSEEIDASGQASHIKVRWVVPSTLYFNNYYSGTSINGGPVIDRVRIYRKRTGSAMSGGIGNGVGADATWTFVDEIAANTALGIPTAGEGEYDDNTPDTGRTADAYPIQKQYPPADAQYVTVCKGRGYYVGTGHVVWNSELKKVGGIDNGELGFEYVAEDSFTEAFDDTPSDGQINAINHYEDQLVVATDERLSVADTGNVDITGLSFRTVPGAAGCASHWCMVETTPLTGNVISGALLLYAHPKGGMYAYNGATSDPMALNDIAETIKSFSPKTWQDISQGFGAITSWYYASVILDSYTNRILMAAPLTAGGSVTMAYDLNTSSWFPWDLNKLCWLTAREWESSARVGRDICVFVDGGSIFKLKDGAADDGENFDWYVDTGRWSFGTAGEKLLDSALACFDIVTVEGSARINPSITLASYMGVSTIAANSATRQLDGDMQVQISQSSGRQTHHKLRVSGTQEEGIDLPALVSLSAKWKPTGIWMKR